MPSLSSLYQAAGVEQPKVEVETSPIEAPTVSDLYDKAIESQSQQFENELYDTLPPPTIQGLYEKAKESQKENAGEEREEEADVLASALPMGLGDLAYQYDLTPGKEDLGIAQQNLETGGRIAGGVVNRLISGTTEAPTDLASMAASLVGAEETAAQLRKASKGVSEVTQKLRKYIPEPEKDSGADLAADIIALGAGGYAGLKSVATKFEDAPKFLNYAKNILAADVGSNLLAGGSATDINDQPLFTGSKAMLPLVAKDTPIDEITARRAVAVAEGVPLAAMFSGAVKGAESMVDLFRGKDGSKAVQGYLEELARIEGYDKPTSKEIAKASLDKAMAAIDNGKDIDTNLGLWAKVSHEVFEKNKPFYNIEKQLKGLKDSAPLENYSDTTRIQRAEQREAVYFDRALRQFIPSVVRKDGEDAILPMTIGGQKVPSYTDVINDVKAEGLDIYDAAKYRHARRLMRDYELAESTASTKADLGTIDQEIKNLLEQKEKLFDTAKTVKGAKRKSHQITKQITELQDKKKLIEESATPERSKIGEDIAELEDYVNGIEAEHPEWAKKVNDIFNLHFDGQLQYLKQFGNIDDKQIEFLKNTYKDSYFPAPRDFPEGKVPTTVEEMKNSISKGKGIRKAEGGDQPYMDPVQAWIWYGHNVSTAGARNDTLNSMMDLMEQLDNKNWAKIFSTPKESYLKRIGTEKAAIDEGYVENSKKFKEMFGSQDDSDLATLHHIGVDDEGKNLTFFRNGKYVNLEVKDPNIAKTLEVLEYKKNAGWVEKLKAVRNFERAVITLNPGFVVANMAMDSFYAPIRSKTGAVPVITSINGGLRAAKHPDLYRFYLNNMGARQSFYGATNQNEALEEVNKLINKTAKEFNDSNGLAEPLKISQNKLKETLVRANRNLEHFASKGENLARFEEWAKTIEKGGTSALGINRASEATLNFFKSGANKKLRDLNSLSVFVNAGLQGMANTGRLLREGSPKFAQAAFKYITMPALAVYEWNLKTAGPENYYSVPQDVRDRNFVIFYGPNKKDYTLIPKERLISPFFAGIPQGYLDDLWYKTGNVNLIHQTVKAFTNLIDLPSLMPVAFTPVIELMTNENRYGKAITPESMQNIPDPEKYNLYTQPTWHALSDAMDNKLNPMQVQHLANTLLGELARTISWFSDEPLRKAMGYPEIAAEKRLPMAQRFFPGQQSASERDLFTIKQGMEEKGVFSDAMKDAYEYYSRPEIRETLDKNKIARVEKYLSDPENQRFMDFYKQFNITWDKMTDLYRELNDVQNSDYDLPVKKEQVDKIRVAQEEVAKDFLENIVLKTPEFKKYWELKFDYGYGLGDDLGRGITETINKENE